MNDDDARALRDEVHRRLAAIYAERPDLKPAGPRWTMIDGRRISGGHHRPKKPRPAPTPSGQPRGPRMTSVVRAAVLELLAIEPLTDSDLVDLYRSLEAERGWPPAAAATIRNTRSRLHKGGSIVEAGLAPALRGQARKLWAAL